MVRAFLRDERVEAPRHERAGVGVLFFGGDLLNHRLNGRKLPFSAERHEYRSRADGGVKLLRKAAL